MKATHEIALNTRRIHLFIQSFNMCICWTLPFFSFCLFFFFFHFYLSFRPLPCLRLIVHNIFGRPATFGVDSKIADKWYPSVLHTKSRASHSSRWYGIQNGIFIIECMRINTNHLHIDIWPNAEHPMAIHSAISIISFQCDFFPPYSKNYLHKIYLLIEIFSNENRKLR